MAGICYNMRSEYVSVKRLVVVSYEVSGYVSLSILGLLYSFTKWSDSYINLCKLNEI